MTAIARIAVALVLLLAGLAPAGAVERILRFVSDVTVERNGDLAVTETIAVQAEGRDIRRGILRDFPTSYRRRDGARVEVGFDVQSVTRDGAPENWATERLSNGVRVRIGSAVPCSLLETCRDAARATEYLRCRAFFLSNRPKPSAPYPHPNLTLTGDRPIDLPATGYPFDSPNHQ